MIIQESQKDKELHFQNWRQARLENLGILYTARLGKPKISDRGMKSRFPPFCNISF